MSQSEYVVDSRRRPEWLEYPRSFVRLTEQGLVHFTPWHIMEANAALDRSIGLSVRYPERVLFPFAYRLDNDDVACWERGKGERVFIVHDFASPGWEHDGEFENVWGWLRAAIEATISWD